MHAKTDSEATSLDASWPPRSPRRPVYYVQSPSNHDVEKTSYESSPTGSPAHHYSQCSPVHHSRESSTSRFSASLKNPRNLSACKHVQLRHEGEDDDEEVDGHDDGRGKVRLAYKPEISVENMVFENFYVQAGSDQSGVPTDMLSLNSTVKISFTNPATFFTFHVTATPWELSYFQLKVASGQMNKFTQSRKSKRTLVTVVSGHQVPLYGGIPVLTDAFAHQNSVSVPLNLTFTMRSRAYILGKLVKTKFYRRIRCSVALRGDMLGKPLSLTNSCTYQ
ncbi:hypothetical protein SLEP1_g43122 [Rubroshorea leprosula]|uniref:Late embryogenesis abundant protein LEA-2 subgroup domain-containing protein n=1 Tax=Rubroshorea leprosula TaxID=152421 RepID=A0AAV5LCQ5_9ROSI|nr:hypothetical protein SLEP1_g43122 [Rubroshorea leprosula]